MVSLNEPEVRNEDLNFNMRKKRNFHQLTLQEKVDVAHDLYIEKKSLDEIAHKFCVTKELIVRLRLNLKANKKYLDKLITKHYAKENRTQKIEEAVEMRLRQFTYIERAASIRHDLSQNFDIDAKDHQIC